ncbi:MAG: hypothetical protein LBP50_03535, partial [Tannerella sp.]|nr:hypothetical protein [Tannerella sp.]
MKQNWAEARAERSATADCTGFCPISLLWPFALAMKNRQTSFSPHFPYKTTSVARGRHAPDYLITSLT